MKKIFFSFSLLFLLNFNFVSAQTPSASTTSQSFIVANVDIYSARIISQNPNNDRNFTLGFSLENLSGIQPAVKYGVRLMKIVNKKEEFADEKIYDETFPLPEKVLVTKTITYTIPDPLGVGDYKLYIESRNESGLILGYSFAGERVIKSQGADSIYIDAKSCLVTAGTSTEKISSQIVLENTDTFFIKCDIANSLGSISLIPSFKITESTIFGRTATPTSEITNSEINSVKGKGSFTLQIPKAIKPGSYIASVFLATNDGIVKTNEINFPYIVNGNAGTIQNVIFDKSSYRNGDKAKVKIYTTAFGDIGTTTLEIKVANSSGKICADMITKVIDYSQPITEIEIPIIKNCDDAQAEVVLYYINKDGQKIILDSRSIKTSLPENKQNINFGIPLIILLTLIIVGVIAWFIKRK